MEIGAVTPGSTALLPDPETYELEYRFWPWGRMINRVVEIVVETAPPSAHIFDYMCGTGFLLSQIVARRPDLIGQGCDSLASYVTYGLEKRPTLALALGDARTYSPAKEQDIIICTSGLHHLGVQDQEPFLRKISRECVQATRVLLAEEALAPYGTDEERLRSAVQLNCDLVRLGLHEEWPSAMIHAVLDILHNDVLLRGECKRDLKGWTSLVERYFRVDSIVQTWSAPSGGGDYLMLCRPLQQ